MSKISTLLAVNSTFKTSCFNTHISELHELATQGQHPKATFLRYEEQS